MTFGKEKTMNNKIKTLSVSLLAAAMCASLAGCANNKKQLTEKDIENQIESIFGGNNGGNVQNPAGEFSKPEPKPLDPFESLEVVFEGISPLVTAKLKGENSGVKYTLSRNKELANGDKVTVTAEISSYNADKYVLTSESKEFTVSDRPYYIMKLSDLTDEEIQKLSKTIVDMVPDDIKGHSGGGEGSTVNSLDFLGNINLTKDGRNYRLYFVYKANVTFANAGETNEYIFAAYYGYVRKENDGTLVFDDGRPFYNSLGDMSLTVSICYVGGAYASVDSLNSEISKFGAEKESNVKV